MSNHQTRFTVNFSQKVNDALAEMAKKHGVPKTEILRKALNLYAFIDNELEGDVPTGKKKGLVITSDGEIEKEIIIT